MFNWWDVPWVWNSALSGITDFFGSGSTNGITILTLTNFRLKTVFCCRLRRQPRLHCHPVRSYSTAWWKLSVSSRRRHGRVWFEFLKMSENNWGMMSLKVQLSRSDEINPLCSDLLWRWQHKPLDDHQEVRRLSEYISGLDLCGRLSGAAVAH